MTKTRLQINVPLETNARVNQIVGAELEKDRAAGKPERSRNAILEWVVNLGVKAWQEANGLGLSQNASNRLNALDRRRPAGKSH
jgi:hypothetical protein